MLRTKQTQKAYMELLENVDPRLCPFCSERKILSSFKFWYITVNRFEYDARCDISEILTTKRHVAKLSELTINEVKELFYILETQMGKYQYQTLNSLDFRSISGHLHFHLLVDKHIEIK